ncbi:MAG: response regulator [Armatimonadota bacterium]|nr:response regulator [Armatimonadota bacterium]MDR7401700.1 response regulator [Armatimonadota bacterium]MDR7436290.1 response regulator [Armatimonadota bacterium]MDR7471330.1 response regulator [Armatimonadota bacterium]MDR7506458.1 response regulator [Armatimonadota bacterium]
MAEPLRVLIADDEAVIRLGLRTMLEEQGYRVVGEAGDGARALDLARKLRPDLILLDIKMPGVDGLQAARELCAERPVIILTAYADREFVERAAAAGVLAYLVKPVREGDLRPAIETALARFREIQALRDEVGSLEDALATRKVVERAKGLLMSQGWSEPEAFAYIQRQARSTRRTMRAVAEEILRQHASGADRTS